MKKLFLFAATILSLLCSCEKMDEPDLGKFQDWESYIDMSQKNQFDESLFCKEWDVDKVYREIYVDGKIKYKEDYTDAVIPWPNFVFNDDHSLSHGEDRGYWLYSHNYLMWRTSIPLFMYFFMYFGEVQRVTADALTLKGELIESDEQIPYFKDESGTHTFFVLELKAAK